MIVKALNGVLNSGIIQSGMYWHDPLTDWVGITSSRIHVVKDTVISFTASWINTGTYAFYGHLKAVLFLPDGTSVELQAVNNQDRIAQIGNGYFVEFEPITLSYTGEYYVAVTLSDEGSFTLAEQTFALAEVDSALPQTGGINLMDLILPIMLIMMMGSIMSNDDNSNRRLKEK
jgi:hypothetical protein